MPFEWLGVHVVGLGEGVDVPPQLLGRREGAPAQGLYLQDTEPYLNLVKRQEACVGV